LNVFRRSFRILSFTIRRVGNYFFGFWNQLRSPIMFWAGH
jgi:hypothetical protein